MQQITLLRKCILYLFHFNSFHPAATATLLSHHSTIPTHRASHEAIKHSKANKAQNETEVNSALAHLHSHDDVEDNLDEDPPKKNCEKKLVLPPDMVVVENGDKLAREPPPMLPSLLAV